MELKVGDKIKDNDPRMGESRVLGIIEILPNGVRAVDSIGRVRKYLRKAIHTDGKARRTGFSLVSNKELMGGPDAASKGENA